MVKDFSAWANAWNDYSRSDVNYLVFVVGGTAALVVLAFPSYWKATAPF